MTRAEEAVELFNQGYCCSQAVLAVFSEDLGLSKKSALRIASGFGGGMKMAQTCGAVTGAIMALGLKNGPDKNKMTEYVLEFVKRFEGINGSVICRELMGCDISTPEGLQSAKEKDLFNTLCPKLVKDACLILEEMNL